MSTNRVCMFVSYFGQFYCGSQYQTPPMRSVMGTYQRVLKDYFGEFHTHFAESMKIASRTDVGVHSAMNAISFVLPPTIKSGYFSLKNLCTDINSILEKSYEPTRVLCIRPTCICFDVQRSLKLKRYIYSFTLTDGKLSQELFDVRQRNIIYDNIVFLKKTKKFDEESMKKAADLLSGVNDFSLFRNEPKELERRLFQRVIRSCEIKLLKVRHCPPLNAYSSTEDYWTVEVSSIGFMHKQIRHMVGSIIAVGQGKLSLKRLEEMLCHPERGKTEKETHVAPSRGLCLKELIYPDGVFLDGRDNYHSYLYNELS